MLSEVFITPENMYTTYWCKNEIFTSDQILNILEVAMSPLHFCGILDVIYYFGKSVCRRLI